MLRLRYADYPKTLLLTMNFHYQSFYTSLAALAYGICNHLN